VVGFEGGHGGHGENGEEAEDGEYEVESVAAEPLGGGEADNAEEGDCESSEEGADAFSLAPEQRFEALGGEGVECLGREGATMTRMATTPLMAATSTNSTTMLILPRPITRIYPNIMKMLQYSTLLRRPSRGWLITDGARQYPRNSTAVSPTKKKYSVFRVALPARAVSRIVGNTIAMP
jgi:hypothetical protein